MLAPANRPPSFIYRSLSALWRGVSTTWVRELANPVSTTCVSGWAQGSTNVARVIDPSAHADGTDLIAHRPHPTANRSLLTAHCSGRARLSTLIVLFILCSSLLALSYSTRAASSTSGSLSPWERAGVRERSLSWLSNPRSYLDRTNGADVFSEIFASRSTQEVFTV